MPIIYDYPGESDKDRMARLNDFEQKLLVLQENLKQTAATLYDQAKQRCARELAELETTRSELAPRLEACQERERQVGNRELSSSSRENAVTRREYDVEVREGELKQGLSALSELQQTLKRAQEAHRQASETVKALALAWQQEAAAKDVLIAEKHRLAEALLKSRLNG